MPVIQGSSDKLGSILGVIRELGLEPGQVCAMGDDLPDLPMLAIAGLAACPGDASAEVVEAAHLVSRAPGGRGAVREVIEVILKHQGVWDELVEGSRGKV